MIPFYTVFTITDGTNTVRIDCQKISKTSTNQILFIDIPKSPASQPLSADPETTAVDLKRVSHRLTINGFIVDDTEEGGDSVPTKEGYLSLMHERKKGPFSITYRGTTYSNNIYIVTLAFNDSEDDYVTDSSGNRIGVSRTRKKGVTLELRRATRRA